jgi:hypothetical protein
MGLNILGHSIWMAPHRTAWALMEVAFHDRTPKLIGGSL